MSYGFRETSSHTGFERLSEHQIAAIESALLLWSDVANVSFYRTESGLYANNATILFSGHNGPGGHGSAWAYGPGDASVNSNSGDVFLNTTSTHYEIIAPSTFAYLSVLHEIGHAIGLLHPGSYNGGTGGYAARAGYVEDTRQFSVMSYFSASNTGAEHGNTYGATPLLHDIAALQNLYGPNLTTRTGDTVYGFNSNADRDVFRFAGKDDVAVFAVWDAGGIDTFDFSGYLQDQRIDLREESFSDIGGLTNNVAIARGTVIENAIGGSGDDVLQGNERDNELAGLDGDDTVLGGGGNDRLIYTAGLDLFDGGTGMDSADFRSSTASVHVDLAEGIARDRVSELVLAHLVSTEAIRDTSHDDILLGDETENLFALSGGGDRIDGRGGNDTVDFSDYAGPMQVSLVLGQATVTGGAPTTVVALVRIEHVTGTPCDDVIAGDGGANRIDGSGGGDSMAGGDGDDVYVVDDPRDIVIELDDEGFDTIITNLNDIDIAGTSVERVIVMESSGARVLGNANTNQIYGNAGNDVIDGGGGADVMVGSRGNDMYWIDDARDIVHETKGRADRDIITSSVSYALPSGVEVLRLTGSKPLKAIGNSAGNDLSGVGSSGADLLVGRGGNDVYRVGAGDRVVESARGGIDQVFASASHRLSANVEVLRLLDSMDLAGTGNAAANTLVGNDGDNVLDGRAGRDLLKGNAGNDIFFFSTRVDGRHNVDRILDFVRGQDKIQLEADVFHIHGARLSTSQFRIGREAYDSDDRIIYDQTSGSVYLDVDGTGGADALLFARLTPGAYLSATDFLLV